MSSSKISTVSRVDPAPIAPREVIHRARAASVILDQVTKVFGKGASQCVVLANINIYIKPGEIVAIIGPSGCGKSTLLRLVAGLDTPTSGVVEVDDHLVKGVDERCAIVFQEPRLLPWRNILSNVVLGQRGRSDKQAATELLDAVGLGEFTHHLPKQISGGMAQRAALARALIGDPGVLLLDEPLASLDALTRLQMQDLLSDVVAKTGATVLLVTHDIDEALHLADRILLLGERGLGVVESVEVALPRPRDRSDQALAPLRRRLLAHFSIHA